MLDLTKPRSLGGYTQSTVSVKGERVIFASPVP